MIKIDINSEWPLNGLETVDSCPVCSSKKSALFYEGLVDDVFYTAPGKWNIYQCSDCSLLYLNPRPTEESINEAYKSYYTHDTNARIISNSLRPDKLFKSIMKNSYMDVNYNKRVIGVPSLPFKWLFTGNNFLHNRLMARWLRHLPKPDPAFRLLDVGSGNGYFLKIARHLGWNATGIDFDDKAVSKAKSQNLNVVTSSAYSMPFDDGCFDYITMNHVIEHLHQPEKSLREIYRVLMKSGTFWLGTPNSNSIYHRREGRNWLHLDSPRHLMIHTEKTLKTTLEKSGFTDIERIVQHKNDLNDWEIIVRASKLK